MRSSPEFSELKGICDLAKKLVETKRDKASLALILPVATVTVDRAFSATNFFKTELQNEIGDAVIE